MAKIPSEIIDLINEFIVLVKKDNIEIYKVILFGSYAKGNYDQHSDIDLAIVSPSFKKGESIENMSNLLSKATELRADIQTFPFTMEEYNSPIGVMEEIIKTGVELQVA